MPVVQTYQHTVDSNVMRSLAVAIYLSTNQSMSKLMQGNLNVFFI